MKETIYYHRNSDVIAFERIEYKDGSWSDRTYDEWGNILTYKNSNGNWYERTYDERGNDLTLKNSNGKFEIKGKKVTEEEFNEFIK